MTQLALLDAGAALPVSDGVQRIAHLSDCGRYRYSLARAWSIEKARECLWVALNPSTADAAVDDPTIRRMVTFAKREGCGAMMVVNLFAFRSTDPAALVTAEDPVGPEADRWLAEHARRADIIIAAWGAGVPKAHAARVEQVLAMLRGHGDVWCLGRTKDGAPRHPLYLPAEAPLELLAEGPTRAPLPLTAPDGRVFAYACRYCQRVATMGQPMVRMEPVVGDAEDAARLCCACRDCGGIEVGCVFRCKACQAKLDTAERPAREARQAEWDAAVGNAVAEFALRIRDALRSWPTEDSAPWPLTVVHGRDGIGVLAFPLAHDEVPDDVAERVGAMMWFDANQAADFGRGRTPEEALADLRQRARVAQGKGEL